MNLSEQIYNAFKFNVMPDSVVCDVNTEPSDMYDAISFKGVAWQDITLENWINHSSALFSFTSDAFKYYMPSLLIRSLECNFMRISAANTFLEMLDTSGIYDYFDEFLIDRFMGLKSIQYSVISDWAKLFIRTTKEYDELTEERVAYTLLIFQEKMEGNIQ
jgi:hypothetical protein